MRFKTPKFVRKLGCKYIAKKIEEETNIRNNIDVHNLILDTKGDNYRVYMAVTIDLNKKDLKKYIKENIKD